MYSWANHDEPDGDGDDGLGWSSPHRATCSWQYDEPYRSAGTKEDWIRRKMILFGRRFTADSELDDYFGNGG